MRMGLLCSAPPILAVAFAAVKTALLVLHSAVGPRRVDWPSSGWRGGKLPVRHHRAGGTAPPHASISSLGAFTILRQLRRPRGFMPSFISCLSPCEL